MEQHERWRTVTARLDRLERRHAAARRVQKRDGSDEGTQGRQEVARGGHQCAAAATMQSVHAGSPSRSVTAAGAIGGGARAFRASAHRTRHDGVTMLTMR